MDRQKAFEILNLSPEATADRILERYHERYNDLKIKITHSPPHMRSVFEKNLSELEEAFQWLNRPKDAPDPFRLPSREKVEEKITPKDVEDDLIQASKKNLKPKGDLTAGPNKWLYFTTFFFFSLAASQFGLYYKAKQRLNEREPLAASGEVFQNNYANNPFSISNQGDEAFYILHITIFYKGDDGHPLTFGYQGDPVLVEAGKSYEAPDIVTGTKVIFDGAGIAYSILLADSQFSTYKAYEGLIPENGKIPLNPDFN